MCTISRHNTPITPAIHQWHNRLHETIAFEDLQLERIAWTISSHTGWLTHSILASKSINLLLSITRQTRYQPRSTTKTHKKSNSTLTTKKTQQPKRAPNQSHSRIPRMQRTWRYGPRCENTRNFFNLRSFKRSHWAASKVKMPGSEHKGVCTLSVKRAILIFKHKPFAQRLPKPQGSPSVSSWTLSHFKIGNTLRRQSASTNRQPAR